MRPFPSLIFIREATNGIEVAAILIFLSHQIAVLTGEDAPVRKKKLVLPAPHMSIKMVLPRSPVMYASALDASKLSKTSIWSSG